MKKILFITCLFVFGLSHGINDIKTEEVILNQIDSCEKNNSDVFSSSMSIEDIISETESISIFFFELDCIAIAMAIWDESIEQGHTVEEANDFAMATFWTCSSLKLLSENL